MKTEYMSLLFKLQNKLPKFLVCQPATFIAEMITLQKLSWTILNSLKVSAKLATLQNLQPNLRKLKTPEAGIAPTPGTALNN